jgi:peptide/nickel transport system permease protein
MRNHILRNVMPQLTSSASILLAWALLDIAALEFIGLAGSPEVPTWGSMIGVGRAYIREAPWLVAAPGLALCASVLGFMLLSNVRQLFDRGRG